MLKNLDKSAKQPKMTTEYETIRISDAYLGISSVHMVSFDVRFLNISVEMVER